MTSIKRGVSLYSLQDAYGRGGLGLEGTIAAVEQMGTQGIEFLSDQMLTGAQNASENTLREWDAIIERHPLDLVSNDIFVNSTLYRNRTLTLEEQAELLSSDLRLANRLGFRLVRVVSRTAPRLIKMTVDLAEKLDVTMAVEIHAGMSFDHPLTAGWINEMKRIGSEHLGIVVDFGIFCQRHPRVSANYFRDLGVNQDVIAYIDDIFASGTDPKHAFKATSTGEKDSYEFPEELTRLFHNPLDQFYAMLSSGYENTCLDVLDEYKPYIKSFHAKFWEMTDDGEEYSIDYHRIFDRLRTIGWSGYVCSEYEGQRFVSPGEPIHDIDQVSAHQRFLSELIEEGK